MKRTVGSTETPGPEGPSGSGVPPRGSATEVAWAFLRLGLTSFGGPVAHLGYFREEFVRRRRWVTDEAYADLVSLCQFLPGPASSQVGMALGLRRAGLPGALAAWAGFTAPSATALTLFALTLGGVGAASAWASGALQGLRVVAVAVIAQAVWGMAKALCPDRVRGSFAVAAAGIVLGWSSPWAQVAAIAAGGLFGRLLLDAPVPPPSSQAPAGLDRRAGIAFLVAFFALLAGAPALRLVFPSEALARFDGFYRAGALVFGGGHVVLPLLQAEVVPPGWVTREAFLAGYGAAQAVPGPLFTFAAFLGAAAHGPPNGWLGAALCLGAVFLPSFLLVAGVLPFWDRLRRGPGLRAALSGTNAAVVGILLAALYDPILHEGVRSAADAVLALAAFGLLALWRVPSWLVVGVTAAAAAFVSAL